MKKRKIILMISFSIFMISAVLLIIGSSVLIVPIINDPYLPLGNVVSWAGIISIPTTIYFAISRIQKPTDSFERIVKYFLLISIILSMLWAPLSYGLSGNFNFVFTNNQRFQGSHLASRIFWYFNYLIILAPIITLALYGIYKFINHILKFNQK